MKKCISGKLQEVVLIAEESVNGIPYELVMYMYKGKEPVYYTFHKGNQYKGFIISTTESNARILTRWLLANKDPEAYRMIDGYFNYRKKFNFTQLKSLKIIR